MSRSLFLNGWIFLLSIGVTEAQAQWCHRDNIPESTPASRFVISGTGKEWVKDTYTGLEWYRCPYGQSLQSSPGAADSCVGTARAYDWATALTTVNGLVGNWHLPDIKEMISIMDVQCFDPPFNKAVFPAAWSSVPSPDSIPVGLWTSTPGIVHPDDNSAALAPMAWFVSYSDGTTKRLRLDQPLFFLPVRKAQ